MISSQLSSLILHNSDSIAFLIGNGIHNYETHEKHVKGKVSWDSLIIEIREKLGVSPNGGIKSLNRPEQFDDVVVEKTKEKIEKSYTDLQTHLTPYIESVEKIGTYNDIRFDGFAKGTSCDDRLPAIKYIPQNKLRKLEEELIEKIRKILKAHGISLCQSSFDARELASHIAMNGSTDDLVAKRVIKAIFDNYSIQDWIIPFLTVAQKLQIPILTTNYDTSLSKLLNLHRLTTVDNESSQLGFPFETYFSTSPIKYPWKNFAIWHIQGIYDYINSIRIGSLDFNYLINEIKSRLEQTKSPNSDVNWEGNNTWLSIVFRKDLFIIGLGLNEDDFAIRWLLKERAKFGLKGWYAYRSGEEISEEKSNFLKDVGFEIIDVDNQDLHEKVWNDLMNKI